MLLHSCMHACVVNAYMMMSRGAGAEKRERATGMKDGERNVKDSAKRIEEKTY